MNTPFHGVFFIAAVMVLSLLGLVLVRRYVEISSLKRHHEVASNFFLMLGTLYAVLIAFAVFAVWSDFKDAGNNLEREASEVAGLYQMSAAFPDPLRSNIRASLLEYVKAVVEDDFPAMAAGREGRRCTQAIRSLWAAYGNGEPTTLKEQIYYAESLKQLNELANYRRIRLFTSRGTVPNLLWWLLCTGGILLIAFTYFFGHESLRSQAIMTAALAGMLAFSLFLIFAFDSPYAGAARVSPAPFELELKYAQAGGK